MAEERTEWPTEERLADLRSQGLVPKSTFASYCFATAAVLITLRTTLPSNAAIIKGVVQGVTEQGTPQSLGMALMSLGEPVLSLLFVPALVAMLAFYGAALLQTRFLIRFEAVAPSLSRFDPLRGPHKRRTLLSALLRESVLWISLLGTAAAIFAFVYPSLIGIALISPAKASTEGVVFVTRVIDSASLLLLAVALFSWLGNRILFMLSHRMTRAEATGSKESE